MEKSQSGSLTGLGNGSAIITPGNLDGKVETLPVSQDTMVTLRQSGKGCYFTRVQVAIFAIAFILSLVLVVLLLTFVRKEQIIHVATENSMCKCHQFVNFTTEEKVPGESTVKNDKKRDNDSDAEVITAENLTRVEDKLHNPSGSTVKTKTTKGDNSEHGDLITKNLTWVKKNNHTKVDSTIKSYRNDDNDSKDGVVTAENLTRVENTSKTLGANAQNESHALNTSDGISTTNHSFPWLNIRLPRDVLPEHYDIYLKIDLENNTVTGAVNISVNISSSKRYIYFHVNFLWITRENVTLWSRDENRYYPVKKQFLIMEEQFWVLDMELKVPVGQYVIGIGRYIGVVRLDLTGLYRSSYEHVDKRLVSLF